MLLIEIIDSHLREAYGQKKALIRCYHERKKFFEMALDDVPQFIDIFESTIAWFTPKNGDD